MLTTPTDALIRALRDRLERELPERLREYDLPLPDEYLDFDPGFLAPTKNQVWVEIVQDRRSDEAGRGATVHKYSLQPTILVGISCSGVDLGDTARKIRQCVDLLRVVVEGDPSAGGQALWVRWMGTDYSPPEAELGLFRSAILTFEANRRHRVGSA